MARELHVFLTWSGVQRAMRRQADPFFLPNSPWPITQGSRGLKLTKSFDFFGNFNGFDFVGVLWVLNAKHARLLTFADQVLCAHHHMLVNEDLGSPLRHARVDLQRFAVGGGLMEFGVNLQQRGAQDAMGLLHLPPRGQTAVVKEVDGRCVHPSGVVRVKDNASRVAVPKADGVVVLNGFALHAC